MNPKPTNKIILIIFMKIIENENEDNLKLNIIFSQKFNKGRRNENRLNQRN